MLISFLRAVVQVYSEKFHFVGMLSLKWEQNCIQCLHIDVGYAFKNLIKTPRITFHEN